MLRTTLLIFALFFCFGYQLVAQKEEKDLEKKVKKTLDGLTDRPKVNDPTKAALLSAVLPGLGQIHNKKYWKLPLIYGGAVAFGAVIRYNQNQYTDFKNELIRQTDDDPSTVPISTFPTSSLRSIRDNARRNRDYTIILSVLFYGLNIVDAAVDAHLKGFNIDDDLSLQIHPTLLPSPKGAPVPALAIKASF